MLKGKKRLDVYSSRFHAGADDVVAKRKSIQHIYTTYNVHVFDVSYTKLSKVKISSINKKRKSCRLFLCLVQHTQFIYKYKFRLEFY